MDLDARRCGYIRPLIYEIFVDESQEVDNAGGALSALDNPEETDAITPIEMTNSTGTRLTDLNEYCLLQIFSCKSLTPLDMCSLAETCKLFKQMTRRSFPKEFQITTAQTLEGRYICRRIKHSRCYRMRDVKRILKNFGSFLVALEVGKTNEVIVDLVAKYSGDVTLKRLEISKMCDFEGLRMQLKPIFQRLMGLSVIDCDLNVISPDFHCDSLIELEIVGSTGCNVIIKNTYPKLERFTFRCNSTLDPNSDDNTDSIIELIGRHRHLRTLHLFGSSMYCSSGLISAIGINCPELEALTLQSLNRPRSSFDVPNLPSLPKLTKLDLDVSLENYDHIIALLQASTLLEAVKLHFETEVPTQIFDRLSQQQHLRNLQLVRYNFDLIPWKMLCQVRKLSLDKIHAIDLLSIIRQLTNLEKLELDCWILNLRNTMYVLSEEDFIQIVKICDQRSNVLTLKCRCNFETLACTCSFNIKCEDQKVRILKKK